MVGTEISEYIISHTNEIAEYADKCLYEKKDLMRVQILEIIKGYLSGNPIHFEWKNNDNPYDKSGIIVENGKISLDQSVIHFLENEYSGNKEPSYESGMGWIYNTYGDELRYEIAQIIGYIVSEVIRKYIEEHFSITISDKEFLDIEDSCDGFNDIFGTSVLEKFLHYDYTIMYVGIGDLLLSAIKEA